MKVKVWLKYEEAYLPPRCRKLRYQEKEEHTMLTLSEAAPEDLRLAFEDTSYEEVQKIYFHKGKFWQLAQVRDISCFDELANNTPLENLLYVLDHCSTFFYRLPPKGEERVETLRADMVKKARSYLSRYLLVGEDLYIRTSEPRYCIYTFGLGHNHGGTSLSVDYDYNPNISKKRYFSALQGEEAVAEATRIALARGDTESIKRIRTRINVFAPDLVKVNPKRQHGDGDPFLNKLETITCAAPDVLTAGLFCMAATPCIR